MAIFESLDGACYWAALRTVDVDSKLNAIGCFTASKFNWMHVANDLGLEGLAVPVDRFQKSDSTIDGDSAPRHVLIFLQILQRVDVAANESCLQGDDMRVVAWDMSGK
jgi:hypothetical protein